MSLLTMSINVNDDCLSGKTRLFVIGCFKKTLTSVFYMRIVESMFYYLSSPMTWLTCVLRDFPIDEIYIIRILLEIELIKI